MQITELLWLAGLSLVAVWWLQAARSAELARRAGRTACADADVSFLDDSVALRRLYFRDRHSRRFGIYREYGFEFSSDGSRRYSGVIYLHGHRVLHVEMEAYRIAEPPLSLH